MIDFQTFVPLFEVVILTVMLNYLLKFFWGTRAMDVVFGFLAFLFIFLLTTWLGFPILEKIMLNVVNIALIAVFIIFQPELRLAFAKLRLRGKRTREAHEYETFIEELSNTVYRFGEKHLGALIVLENQDSYTGDEATGIHLNATFSPELLEAIFLPNSPLHDGAVVLRGSTLVLARVILPLAHEGSDLAKSMGTRHRAALGASQKSDALIIVVSEESGRVSIAREGILTRGVKIDRFRGIVRNLFVPSKSVNHPLKNWQVWKSWVYSKRS